MQENEIIKDPLPVKGVRLSGVDTGVRYQDRDDLALIEVADTSEVACVFTSNVFRAAPVTLAQEHLRAAKVRYLVINAGNANAGTGAQGYAAAQEVCAAVAAAARCEAQSVLPFSTGVIGEQLPAAKIADALPAAFSGLRDNAWADAAAAIMTTDTHPKFCSFTVQGHQAVYTITGMSKGAGMIKPDMATMLAFVATDAAISRPLLEGLVRDVAAQTFNRITVDGDTSTNDAFALIATGQASGPTLEDVEHPDYAPLKSGLIRLSGELARAIVRDAEGATRFISIAVVGGASERDCLQVAYTVAESPLVKTAFFAGDPNWGRILAAIGRARIANLAIDAIDITLGDYPMIKEGQLIADYDEARAAAIMQAKDVSLTIAIGKGYSRSEIWTCDLSYNYVKINAEYRS